MSTIPLLTVVDTIWPSPLAVRSHRPTRSAIPSPPPPLPPSTTRGPSSPPPPCPLLMVMTTTPVPRPSTASALRLRGRAMVTEVGRVIRLQGAPMNKKKEEGVVIGMVATGLSGLPPTGMVGDTRSLLACPGPATRTSMLLLLHAAPSTNDRRRNMMHLLLACLATNDKRRSMAGPATNDVARTSIAGPATALGKRGRPLTVTEENAAPNMGMTMTMKKRSIVVNTTTIASIPMMSDGWRPLSKWMVWLRVPYK